MIFPEISFNGQKFSLAEARRREAEQVADQAQVTNTVTADVNRDALFDEVEKKRADGTLKLVPDEDVAEEAPQAAQPEPTTVPPQQGETMIDKFDSHR